MNRNCREDYIIKETGLVLEKDIPVLIPIDGIHNDPEFHPEPEKFNPERFADGKKQQLAQSCMYMPFGMGPRNCIGKQLRWRYFKKQIYFEFSIHTFIQLALGVLKKTFLYSRCNQN